MRRILDDSHIENLIKLLTEQTEKFTQALEQGGDRAVVIVSACLLDNLLERLIQAFYVRDPSVKTLFKNDHILQSFFSKINIAYFSGLIPKFIYHDLRLICEIRNKFAHEPTIDLTLGSDIIARRINKCETRPKDIDDSQAYGIKFTIIIQLLISHLLLYEQCLIQSKPLNLVESFGLNDETRRLTPLTKDMIYDVLRKAKPFK